MSIPTAPAFPPARIVGLVIIAVLATGLVYLRLPPGDEAVSVPDGAKAGDLILDPCLRDRGR